MLQQTTVAAVIPYFGRFLARFPTVKSLAAADEQDVLRLWQGLGYYRRARNLHAAARKIVAECNSLLSDDPNVWRDLPGVGRYMLGAILSQAFDHRLPIVEANSSRVLCRLFGQHADPKSSKVKRWLWQTAESMLPRKRVGDFNQAIMELGALICTPADPHCIRCPVRNECQAFRDGTQHRIPLNGARTKPTEVREVAVLVRRDNRVLIAQRPPDAQRWANMWEFPQSELQNGESHEQAARRWLRQSLGLGAKIGTELTTVRYAVTRFRMTLVALNAQTSHKSPDRNNTKATRYADARLIKLNELQNYPMSTAQRLLAQIVSASARQKRLF